MPSAFGKCIVVVMLLSSLQMHAQMPISTEAYHATLDMQGQQLGFKLLLEISVNSPDEFVPMQFTLVNGVEQISGQVIKRADSFVCVMPVFNTEIVFVGDAHLKEIHGRWYDHSRTGNYFLPFKATQETPDQRSYRYFQHPATPITNISGTFAVRFNDGETTDNTVGVFEQTGNYLKGTFLTTTGDYRFLEGEVSGDKFYLSAFDGSHAFIFQGKIFSADSIVGAFFSGIHYLALFNGKRDANAALPDESKLTFLKPGYDKIAFSFPDENGKMVSLDDPKFANKALVITITGSWCPNCMDETSYLSEIEDTYKKQGLEIIALSFERKTDPETFAASINKVRQHFGTDFTYLNAGLPKTAGDALPMLNKVMGFPTMILLDRHHQVVAIHTGFSGPATGQLFLDFQKKFETELQQALR